ncbi:MAG: C40 family peptidase [Agathobacter sp.]|nr:C40 family peptidase [Agathobacter sp.]
MKKRMRMLLCVCVLIVLSCIGCGSHEEIDSTEDINGTESIVTETTETDEVEGENSEYADLAIADVSDYVNIRKEPNTDAEIVGKIYDGAVAQILEIAGENDEWFKVISGNAEGYIKAEFFIYGDAAIEVIDEYVTRYIEVTCDRLNVRTEPTTDSGRIGYVDFEERLQIVEEGIVKEDKDWIKVKYINGKEGYVSADYVVVVEEFIYGKTIEEERAELEALRELEERENENNKVENTTIVIPPTTNYTSNEELRKAIINYALQFVGYPYVHGGQSLAGTDCSGFTMLILREFGYSISRTPQGQYTGAGRAIDYSQIQPGDIICYSDNGSSCTHVAFYIGNGQIVHAANSRDGVKISSATAGRNIIGVRNVID